MRLRARARAVVGTACAAALVTTFALAPPVSAESAAGSRHGVSVTELMVNGLPGDQLGLGDPRPTLQWRMAADAADGNPCFDDTARGTCALDEQTAYEVQVSSSATRFGRGQLVWGTGKVASAEQTVELGTELAPRDDVHWRVRVWDANGRASGWSSPSRLTIGLLDNAQWSGRWIEDPDYTYATNGVPNPLPIFATQFDLKRKVVKASLYATGLGQYAATLNGAPVGDAVLEPGQTSYWKEVSYRTYDVTDLLQRGPNVLGFEVGSGAYQQADTTSMQRYNFQPEHKEVMGTPKVRAQLEVTYTDGSVKTVATDGSWKARSGPTVFSSWWGGEDYDGRVLQSGWTGSPELSTEDWHRVRLSTLTEETIPRASTPLVADPRPPVKIAEEVEPVSITEQQPAAVTTTVAATAAAGAEKLLLGTTTGVFSGDEIVVGGTRHTVTDVGIGAKTPTTLTAAASPGDTSIAVANLQIACYRGAVCEGSAGFVVGQPLVVGSGVASETVTVTAVTRTGTGNSSPGTVAFTPALNTAHASGAAARGAGTGLTIEPALPVAVAEGTPVTSVPKPAYVLDYGRNLVGLLQVNGAAPAGTTASLLGSEQPTPPTDLSTVTNAGIYRYTFAGTGEQETWHAQFTYNGQRYLVVRGLPTAPTAETVKLLVTYASNERTSTFETCDQMLNSIYDITERALEGNMLSVLTDCPNREKGPYTGDNLHNIDAELTMFDMRSYQGQLVQNMRTSQRPTPIGEGRQPGKYEGMIANIAPEYHAVPDTLYNGRWFLDEPNWGGAIVRIPWEMYRVYGDDSLMEPNYEAMVKWLEYTGRSKQENPSGEINGLGDWSAGQATVPAEAIIDIGYYEGAAKLALVAQHLGKSADAERYEALAAQLREEYNADYLHVDVATGRAWYANDTQASNAVALDSGLVPDEHRAAVFDSLVRAVQTYDFRLSHGSVAGGAVFRSLHAGGRDDLLYRMVVNPQSPSYAFQVLRGQTTLAEGLNGRSSQNHHFLGQVASWMVHDLVGIEQAPGSTAYRQLRIQPAVGEGIDAIPCVSATYTTPAGESSAEITRKDGGLIMGVTVPPNTWAEVWVPRADGQDVLAPRRATFDRDENGYAVYTVGAGSFSFTAGTGVLPEVGAGDVRVRGQAVVGRTLTAVSSGWDPKDADLTYQWVRDGAPVEGATSASYRVATEDAGHRLAVTITARAPGRTAVGVTSAPTSPVRSP